MQRSKFIMGLLAGVPLAACAQTKSLVKPPRRGFKAPAGEGRYHGSIKLKGVNENILHVKVSGKDTDGALAIFEQTSLSPKRGTPLHVHHFQDEVFYVLEGEYVFQVGEDRHELKSGDAIFLPQKVPHAWTQVSNRGRMTVTMQPAGKLEEFFVTMAALKAEPTPAEIARIFADNEMEVVGPPLKVD